MTLVSIFISTSSTVPTCLILIEYVREICMMSLHVQFLEDMCTSFFVVWDLCLHVQFLEDMCTSFVFFLFDLYKVLCLYVQFLEGMCTNSNLYRIYASIFNSHRICARILAYIESVLAYLILVRYVHNFCILTCLTIFGMKDPLGMLKHSLGSIILFRSVLVMILTYHEVLMMYDLIRKG